MMEERKKLEAKNLLLEKQRKLEIETMQKQFEEKEKRNKTLLEKKKENFWKNWKILINKWKIKD